MSIFAYARSGSAPVKLAVQQASLHEAGYLDIAVDRTHGRIPRDLARRAKLLQRLEAGDTVVVYRLDCLAVSRADLVTTIAYIRARNATLLTTGAPGGGNLCNDTLDAIAVANGTLANRRSELGNVAPPGPGRSAILGPADWPQVQEDCSIMSLTAVAKHHKISRSTLYNYIRRMRQMIDIEADAKEGLPSLQRRLTTL